MTTTPLTDQQLADAFVTAAAADSMKPNAERSGLVNVMIAVVRPELDRLAARAETLQVGALEREALLADARDLLEPYGGHGDDWPAISSAISTLLQKLADAEAELGRVRAELAMTRTMPDGDDLPLLCPTCVCADCGGTLDQHTSGAGCSCGCDPACDRFIRDSKLDLIAESVEPITDSPLAEAIAHAVWHALNPAVSPSA